MSVGLDMNCLFDVVGVTGIAMNNLAVTYSELEMHADALALFERALAFRQRVLPEDHPDKCDLILDALQLWHMLTCDTIDIVGAAHQNLSDAYARLGRYADAVVHQERVLELKRRTLPDDHPDLGGLIFRCIAIVVQVDM